jgi:hypothetical protein
LQTTTITRRSLLCSASALSLLPRLAGGTSGGSTGSEFRAVVRLGVASAGVGNHRWALIEQGEVWAGHGRGEMQSGRLDWHVDPATGAVEARVDCRMRGAGQPAGLRQAHLAATRLDDDWILLRTIDGV